MKNLLHAHKNNSIIYTYLLVFFLLITQSIYSKTNNEKITIISNPDALLVLITKTRKLPETYVPRELIEPRVTFSFKEKHEKRLLRKEAAQALEKLFEAAQKEGITLWAVSGYRSYARQKTIFNTMVEKHGYEKASKLSAQAGHSEHQAGLAMDVSCPEFKGLLEEHFANTPAGKWLAHNSAQFGFIIRYGKNKELITGYAYEPWHLRYVGIDAAQEIVNKDITLNQYLEQTNK